jgi:hypothetical protein
MNDRYKWERVNKRHPCTVCGRTDYDTYCVALNFACCMRPEAEKGAIKRAGNGGWLHKLSDEPAKYVPTEKPEKPVTIDAQAIWDNYRGHTSVSTRTTLAELLGVDPMALVDLGCVNAWDHLAWAFPMRDARASIIGFRLRNAEGDKWSVKGSKAGLFIPKSLYDPEIRALPPIAGGKTLFCVEGPTSCAAMLTMGLQAIGRPSCLGQESMVNEFIKIRGFREVILVADADPHDAGQRGAEKLQATLRVPSVLIMPPCKDARELLKRAGPDAAGILQSIVRSQVWCNPK